MDRLVVPAPEVPVLRLPWPGESRLTLPGIQPLRLVLPGDMVPVVPGIAAGAITGGATVAGVGRAVANAAGAILGAGYVTEATASASAKAAGTAQGAASVSGIAVTPAAGSVAGAGSVSGVAIAVLAGAVAGAGTVSGAAAVVLAGSVTAAGSVTGTATARGVASGAISGAASISGTAVRATLPMGMDKVGPQDIPGGSYTKITGWTQRSGYPDTDIFNDGLRLRPGTYSSIAFTAAIENGRQLRLRIMKGTTQIGFIDSGGNVLNLTCTATTVTIAEGDLVYFEANPTAGRQIQDDWPNGSGTIATYVIATPA